MALSHRGGLGGGLGGGLVGLVVGVNVLADNPRLVTAHKVARNLQVVLKGLPQPARNLWVPATRTGSEPALE